jgi:hypothetical protein
METVMEEAPAGLLAGAFLFAFAAKQPKEKPRLCSRGNG